MTKRFSFQTLFAVLMISSMLAESGMGAQAYSAMLNGNGK